MSQLKKPTATALATAALYQSEVGVKLDSTGVLQAAIQIKNDLGFAQGFHKEQVASLQDEIFRLTRRVDVFGSSLKANEQATFQAQHELEKLNQAFTVEDSAFQNDFQAFDKLTSLVRGMFGAEGGPSSQDQASFEGTLATVTHGNALDVPVQDLFKIETNIVESINQFGMGSVSDAIAQLTSMLFQDRDSISVAREDRLFQFQNDLNQGEDRMQQLRNENQEFRSALERFSAIRDEDQVQLNASEDNFQYGAGLLRDGLAKSESILNDVNSGTWTDGQEGLDSAAKKLFSLDQEADSIIGIN
jgi:hypothetical protein